MTSGGRGWGNNGDDENSKWSAYPSLDGIRYRKLTYLYLFQSNRKTINLKPVLLSLRDGRPWLTNLVFEENCI